MSEARFTEWAQAVLRLVQKCSAELGRGHAGSEHLLLGLIREGKEVVVKMLQSAGLGPESLRAAIIHMVGAGAPDGAPSQRLTPRYEKIIELSLTEAVRLGHYYVGVEHLLLDILREGDGAVVRVLSDIGVEPRRLRADMVAAMGGETSPSLFRGGGKTRGREYGGDTKLLDQPPRDLTRLATGSMLGPVVGRDRETNRAIQILSRHQKSNPALIGESNVGGTAVAEGLARRMVTGDVPDELCSRRPFSLDLSSAVVDTKYRDEFKERVENTLAGVCRVGGIILLINELYITVGAGSAEEAIDATNIIKPALGRGGLQVIGTITAGEHHKYVEKDVALERCFQPVLVLESDRDAARTILRSLRDCYGTYHRLQITDESIDAAVALSTRYIGDRHLPDKIINLIDEACSRVRMERLATPPDLWELEEKVEHTHREKKEAIRGQDFEKAAMLRDTEEDFRRELEQQETAWYSDQNTGAVTARDVAAVASGQTGVLVTTPAEMESARLLGLEEALHRRVAGQGEVVWAAARAVHRDRVGPKEPGWPTGCFLFLDPTGVGKTELYKTLVATLLSSEEALLHFDMSEYMEKHVISRLTGSPPGCVDHGEGGQFVEKVQRRSYCVTLFDEIEKTRPDIWGILLRIMEDGMVTDARGCKADFENTIVVLTSNVGIVRITIKGGKLSLSATEWRDGKTRPIEELKAAVLDDLKKMFHPKFLNRLDETIVSTQLGRTKIQTIARRMLERVGGRMKALGVTLRLTDQALETLVGQSFDPDYGARPPRRTIRAQMEDIAAEQLFNGAFQVGDTALMDGVEDGLHLYAQPAGTQALNTKENEL